uniref:Mannose receptor, C type 1b n=1 Tax=Anabas testudineus TaxID=64144 RepID=A0AAQ6IHY3_ANATE
MGVQGKSVGSEISLYDCDENNELQKWECKNETLLALKGQELYIELTLFSFVVLFFCPFLGLSEKYTIGGNAYGKPCMFPFLYKDEWYHDCTTTDLSDGRLWCAVETKYEHELWGFCPTNSKETWKKHITTGAYYQLNTQSALTWSQAEASCKQQGASLLSITDPHEQAYVTGKGDKLWIGLILNSEHGWQWSNGKPYRYLNWDSGHPLPNPGHSCAIVDGAVQYSWQSSQCTKKLGYICYSEGAVAPAETGFCSRPWIPYNGHCFHLDRTQKTWSDAQKACRKEGGDLVSMHNVEDQSFVISQLGYASTDELWIGLNDKKTEGLFDWSDHSTVSFTSWEYGKPGVGTDIKDCILIRGENGNWDDHACDEKHGFICMKESASEPSGDELDQNIGCKSGWKRHGSYCYFVGTQTKTFDEAKDDCKSSDSYLADVTTGVDNAFLISLVGSRPEKYFWLGLSNQKNIDAFVWTNSDSVRFTHWNAEMPGHQQGCVAMTTGIFAGLWDVLPCSNKEKYICKHQAEGAVPTTPPPTPPPLKCADGWNPLATRKVCYKVFSLKRTWYEARDYCNAIGGDLLSIHNHAQLQVKPSSYTTVWIGLNAPDPLTGYIWSDKSPVNFQHWRKGQPNNKNNVQSCAEFITRMWDENGSWNDAHCEKKNGWVCQIRIGKKYPNNSYVNTSDGWLEWNGTQYYINNERNAMTDARKFCQQRHGDLVSFTSEAESIFLWQQVSSDMYTTLLMLWMDGSQVVFQRWDEGQPDFKNYDENCVAMQPFTGFWHDYNCGLDRKSICKRSGSPPANSTVAPTVPPKGGCPSNWKKLNSKCYRIIRDQKSTWHEARKHCQSLGGNLASISSRHVQGLFKIFFLIYSVECIPKQKMCYYTFEIMLEPNCMLLARCVLSQDKCVVINTDPALGIGKWTPTPCNDTNGFICLQNVDAPEPTSHNDYVDIFNDSIKVITQQMNWDAAKKYCENEGANLASLRNQWTHAYVELLALNLKAPLWIGLNKQQTNGYYKYIDGWKMRFTQWDDNEPRTDQPCVYIDVDGKWKTASCNMTIYSVCMKSTDVPPTESSNFPGVCPENPNTANSNRFFWIPFKGNCYMFFTEERTWPDAATSCARHGGSLASIEDSFEQEFFKNNVKTFEDSHPSFWIGLYKTHKGEWMWLDQSVMDFTNWGEGQPIDYSYGRIVSSDGKWKAGSPGYRSYICKTPKGKIILNNNNNYGFNRNDEIRPHNIFDLMPAWVTCSSVMIIAFFLFRKSGHRVPIPDTLTNFANPLFFSNDQSQADVADTKKLVENEEEKNPEPIITHLHDKCF